MGRVNLLRLGRKRGERLEAEAGAEFPQELQTLWLEGDKFQAHTSLVGFRDHFGLALEVRPLPFYAQRAFLPNVGQR